MRKFLLAFSVILIVLIIVGLAYFGIIPLPGDLLNVKKPKDLGVSYTQQDYDDFLEKTHSQVLDYADASEELKKTNPAVVFTEPADYNTDFSNSEISARINYAKWTAMPAKNVQVKFSDNGVIETSGNLDTSNLRAFASSVGYGGYSSENAEKGLNWLEKIGSDPAFYIKATAEITNNELTLHTQEVQINRIPLPADTANNVLTTLTETIVKSVSGLNAEKVTIGENSFNFRGSAPSKIYSK